MLLKSELEKHVFLRYKSNQKHPSFKVMTIKYCLNFKTKPILNTRYYAATCKMYINIYTQRQGITHIYNLNTNSNMEPLHCLPSSENLGEATGNIIFIRNGMTLVIYSPNLFAQRFSKFPKKFLPKYWKSV